LSGRSLYRAGEHWQESEEALTGFSVQAVNAVSKLRVAGATDRVFAQWARLYSAKQKLSLQTATIKDRLRLVNMVAPTLAPVLACVYLLGRKEPLADFLVCNAALSLLMSAASAAADHIASLVRAANLWQRVGTILTATPEKHAGQEHPGRLAGSISVKNVSFRYRAAGPVVLDGVSIEARPGECIAITGPSGSGKSALIGLLLGLMQPQSGSVSFDGRELGSLDAGEVRRQIGVVMQDGRILAGSIYENICAAGAHSMEAAWEAARAAGLAEDLEDMPMGMQTMVAEGGSNLSGGQRQRLLIARALILKPAILIFDEATSALDNRTQAIVTASLKRLAATRIVVAHRLSTIRDADRIYVLENGRVVQQGTYASLTLQAGLFSRLATRQRPSGSAYAGAKPRQVEEPVSTRAARVPW
jgi:ABC-type bacteriocin/lantibiotic exporter with double-glycine peptidase domain